MSQKNTVISGLAWKFGERTLAQGISFLVSIVLARILLPSDYGAVSMVMIFILFADVFVSSGFSTSLIQKKDADETDFSTIFYCSFTISILAYIILYLMAPYIAHFYKLPILTNIVRVLGLRVPLGAYNSIQHAYVSRNMQFKKFFFSTLFGTILSGIVGIFAAYKGAGTWALVAQYLTNTVVDTIILSITIKWKPKLLFSMQSAKSLMSYGWKILVADFSGTFFDQLRSLIIGKYYTTTDLAYYNRGKQFASLLSDNISSSVMTVLFPAFANEVDDLNRVKSMLRKGVRMLSYIIFPMGFGLAAVSKPLVIVLLTEKWLECVPMMQILCISAVLGIVGTASLQSIKALGRSDMVLKLEFVKKPVYLLLLIVGVKISVKAVAVTMLIYTVYSTLVNASPLRKIVNYSYREQISDLTGTLLLSGVMFISVWELNRLNVNNWLKLIVQVLCGIVIYIGGSALTKNESFIELRTIIKNKFGREKKYEQES